MDRHDDEAGGPARGVQGAAANRARGDGGRQRRADGRPDREGGGEGAGDSHGRAGAPVPLGVSSTRQSAAGRNRSRRWSEFVGELGAKPENGDDSLTTLASAHSAKASFTLLKSVRRFHVRNHVGDK